MRGDFSNGPGMAGTWKVVFSNGPGRHIIGDFSNGPGRAGKKRNEIFNGRIWLQKKKEKK